MFAGDAEILAKSLRLDGRAYQIIGVMPAAFGYPHDTDLYESSHGPATQVWIPLVLSPGQKADRDDGDGHVLARLRNGVTGMQAQMEMRGIMSRLDRLHDPRMRGFRCIRPTVSRGRFRPRSILDVVVAWSGFSCSLNCVWKRGELVVGTIREPGARAGHPSDVGGRKKSCDPSDFDRISSAWPGEWRGWHHHGVRPSACTFYGWIRAIFLGCVRRLSIHEFCFLSVSLLTSVLFGILPAVSPLENQSHRILEVRRQGKYRWGWWTVCEAV